MKSLLKHSLFGIPTALILGLVTVGIAAAIGAIVYTTSIPASISIDTTPPGPEPSFTNAVYSDELGTTPVTSFAFGTLKPGASTTQTVYVKNTGNQPIAVTVSSNLDAALGTVTGDTVTLAVGEIKPCQVTATVASSPTGGDYNFDVAFESRSP